VEKSSKDLGDDMKYPIEFLEKGRLQAMMTKSPYRQKYSPVDVETNIWRDGLSAAWNRIRDIASTFAILP